MQWNIFFTIYLLFIGYRGLICEIDVDECETDICGAKGKCENTPGSYKCTCPKGLCGSYCALQDPCLQFDLCEHGKCISNCKHQANYTCECEKGFHGTSCNETMVTHTLPRNMKT